MFSVEVFATIQAALREAPSLAIVATPSACHREALEILVRSKVPFYVEKPVATTMEGLPALLERTDVTEPVTMVGCNLRFLPSLQTVQKLIREGACGRIVRAHLECGQWLPDWRPTVDYRQSYSARRHLGGGVLMDLIHEIDMVRWFFGEFDRVDAHHGRLSDLEIETEDVACILLSRREGPIVTVALDYVARHPVRQYRIIGTQGTIEWDLPARLLRRFVPGEGWLVVQTDPKDFDVAGTYLEAMRQFLQCVETGKPSSQPLSEGVASLGLALRAAGPLEVVA